MRLVAVTLSMIVLNKLKNREIRANFHLQSKGQQETPLRILFNGKEMLHVDKVMKFIGLKRSALKYRNFLLSRYGEENEKHNKLLMQSILA